MNEKRRQAFETRIADEYGLSLDRHPDGRYVDPTCGAMWMLWQDACNWCAKPPEPNPGALVLDGQFFTRK